MKKNKDLNPPDAENEQDRDGFESQNTLGELDDRPSFTHKPKNPKKPVSCKNIKDDRKSLECYDDSQASLHYVIIGLSIAVFIVGSLVCFCYWNDRKETLQNTPGKTVDQ